MGVCCSTEATNVVAKGNGSNALLHTTDEQAITDPKHILLNEKCIHTPKRTAVGHHTLSEAPGKTHRLSLGGYSLQYSYYSKRGYYPEAPTKANQDCYYCETHFAEDPQKAFFAVFDGHGQRGDICAQFAADKLQENLRKYLDNDVGAISALTKAHVVTNKQLHEAPIDDSMSGTTSISVFFSGNEIYVANVGDSRAIIAQEITKDHLVAKPLSIDQTPFRKDERERVKKYGARILTVEQVEGIEPIHENWGINLGDEIDENGDPPRIWHPYGHYPGTAFTRSIGDLVSEELGVTAEPEILCKELSLHDRFIVIASDGVFEFLTSQNVVDLVKQYEDPSEACQALVEEAYSRWLQYEVRTDDITAICIYVEDLDQVEPDVPRTPRSRDGGRSSISIGAGLLEMQSFLRPVRGSRNPEARRETIMGSEAVRFSLTEGIFEDEASSSFLSSSDTDNRGVKTEEEAEMIKELIQSNFMFNNLSEDKIEAILSVLRRRDVASGDVVIEQGKPGDTFYLVGSGEYEVRKLDDMSSEVMSSVINEENTGESNELDQKYGPVVHVYNTGNNANVHPTFGELALIYSKPRAASVIARAIGTLWTLDRRTFRAILMRGRPMRDVVHRLRQVDVLRPLTVAQTNLMVEEMQKITLEPSDVPFLNEKDIEEGFYLIISGCIEKFKMEAQNNEKSTNSNDKKDPNQTAPTSIMLSHLDYFGEKALIRRDSRSQFSYRVLDTTDCLFINKKTLERSVGSISNIVAKANVRRKRKEAINRASIATEASSKNLVLFDEVPQPIEQKADKDAFGYLAPVIQPPPKKGPPPEVLPISMDELQSKGSPILSSLTNTIRLVEVDTTRRQNQENQHHFPHFHMKKAENSTTSPTVYMTLRTASKQAIFEDQLQKHVCGERDLYISLTEPNALVPKMYALHTSDSDIHFLYNTAVVGTLQSFLESESISGHKREPFVRFYAAQVVMAMEYLHKEGILLRSLDPTSIMVDRNGNLRFMNLRLSKYVGNGRTYTVCGTPEYLAPEQIKGEGHTILADAWALGILMYELYTGSTPFHTNEIRDDMALFNEIVSFQPSNLKWPDQASLEIRDLVSQLLQPEASSRIGAQFSKAGMTKESCIAIKKHPFFTGTSWEATMIGSFSAPLSIEAGTKFQQLVETTNDNAKSLDIGMKYEGSTDWLNGF